MFYYERNLETGELIEIHGASSATEARIAIGDDCELECSLVKLILGAEIE
jgi:hypothetical protein